MMVSVVMTIQPALVLRIDSTRPAPGRVEPMPISCSPSRPSTTAWPAEARRRAKPEGGGPVRYGWAMAAAAGAAGAGVSASEPVIRGSRSVSGARASVIVRRQVNGPARAGSTSRTS